MVIDSSALVAILLREPERAFFVRQILGAKIRLVSAVTFVETGMVLEGRRGQGARHQFSKLLEDASIEIVPVDAEIAMAALAAWRKYGKGRHPAGLNLGDCFSYAVAKRTGEPLLAKGDDFSRTDIELCPQAPATQ